jgi:MoxR-like ATPase
MATARETLRSLEEKIKIKSGNPANERALTAILMDGNAMAIAEYKSLLRTWLVKQGIPEKDTKFASETSLVRSYCIPNYLRNWRNRVNPSFALLGEDDDEIEQTANEAMRDDSNSAKPAAEPQEAAAGDMTAQQSEKWLKDLWAQIDRSVTSLVTDRLNRTEIKLSDTIKAQIRQLGEDAARAKIEELMPPRRIEIFNREAGTTINVGHQHEKFPLLLKALSARDHRGLRLNIWLTGPTGSGKTSACAAAAKALGLEFEAEGSLDADYKLMGFFDAQGRYVETAFFRRYTKGGIILLDEIDNYSPSALLAVNAATANGFAQFPCGLFQRHSDCIIIACANTWGLGATNDYTGRTRLDAATLDRFSPKINWNYDEALERAVANGQGGQLGLDWFQVVKTARGRAHSQGLKIIVSPRATYNGIALLQQGFAVKDVVEMTLGAGISPEQFKAIGLDRVDASPFEKVTGKIEALATMFNNGEHPRHSEILDFIRENRMIDAIKTYRSLYDTGFLEAKNAVEAIRDKEMAADEIPF